MTKDEDQSTGYIEMPPPYRIIVVVNDRWHQVVLSGLKITFVGFSRTDVL